MCRRLENDQTFVVTRMLRDTVHICDFFIDCVIKYLKNPRLEISKYTFRYYVLIGLNQCKGNEK